MCIDKGDTFNIKRRKVFKDFENRENPNYKPAYPDTPFPNKPSAINPRYADELSRRGLSRLDVRIKAIGVFDTVGEAEIIALNHVHDLTTTYLGSLGIPRIPWLEKLRLQTRSTKEYLFYDTSLNDKIENAFQALALDEVSQPLPRIHKPSDH